MPKNKKLALKLRVQTYQILTNDDKVCIPSLSSILLAVHIYYLFTIFKSKVSLGMILLFTWHEVERFSRFFINWLNLPYLPYYYVTRLEHKASISLNSTQFSPKKSRQLLRRLFYDIPKHSVQN